MWVSGRREGNLGKKWHKRDPCLPEGLLSFSHLLPFSGSIKALLPDASVCDGAEFLRSICQCQTLSTVSVRVWREWGRGMGCGFRDTTCCNLRHRGILQTPLQKRDSQLSSGQFFATTRHVTH